MKYLFSVDNLGTDSTKLFSVEAESEEFAKAILTQKFLPLMPGIDFDTLADGLANGMDVVISYLGPTSQIEEL